MIEKAIGHGFTYGVRPYDAPIERVEIRKINGYQYQAMVPTIEVDGGAGTVRIA
ncbi:MAG TPA: hypothetical protein VNT54_17285 [Solirubrobacteraceae bacterium]|nr:hypothetical protein [Solirubrobacteraceae bacterium]